MSSKSAACSCQGPAGDWGFPTDRAWLTNADGTVSHCRRVGTGDYVRCDRFGGTTWTTSTSPFVDVGFPDTFPSWPGVSC